MTHLSTTLGSKLIKQWPQASACIVPNLIRTYSVCGSQETCSTSVESCSDAELQGDLVGLP